MKKIISFFKGQADINKQHEQTTPTPSELGKSEVDVASRLPTVQLDLTKFKLKQQELVIERPNFEIKPLALPKLELNNIIDKQISYSPTLFSIKRDFMNENEFVLKDWDRNLDRVYMVNLASDLARTMRFNSDAVVVANWHNRLPLEGSKNAPYIRLSEAQAKELKEQAQKLMLANLSRQLEEDVYQDLTIVFKS